MKCRDTPSTHYHMPYHEALSKTGLFSPKHRTLAYNLKPCPSLCKLDVAFSFHSLPSKYSFSDAAIGLLVVVTSIDTLHSQFWTWSSETAPKYSFLGFAQYPEHNGTGPSVSFFCSCIVSSSQVMHSIILLVSYLHREPWCIE